MQSSRDEQEEIRKPSSEINAKKQRKRTERERPASLGVYSSILTLGLGQSIRGQLSLLLNIYLTFHSEHLPSQSPQPQALLRAA